MDYISTRGNADTKQFDDLIITGLASDGGLYVPTYIPTFSKEQIADLCKKSYPQIAYEVIRPFVDGAVPNGDLLEIVERTYTTSKFQHPEIAPLKKIGDNQYLLELFHGPTLAFKDFAMQLLGHLLDYVLAKKGKRTVIIAATSGDTGSSAIEACKHCKNVDMFVLHPHNNVSEVQRRQMTTVLSDNVHNIALEGSFDDCQHIVKTLFQDKALNSQYNLSAVNSINWARLTAQIVYYFTSALALGAPEQEVAYSVPTGNFGDIYAGYIAKQMGLPIKQLIIATNQNDILHRFLSENKYKKESLSHTVSPSMDIMVASNFERLLFNLYEGDTKKVSDLMAGFADKGITVGKSQIAKAREIFASARVDETEILETIADIYKQTGEVIDPHTAVGVKAAMKCDTDSDIPMVMLATAHPAKFGDAIERAGLDPVALPEKLQDLLEREEKYEVYENSPDIIKSFIQSQLS